MPPRHALPAATIINCLTWLSLDQLADDTPADTRAALVGWLRDGLAFLASEEAASHDVRAIDDARALAADLANTFGTDSGAPLGRWTRPNPAISEAVADCFADHLLPEPLRLVAAAVEAIPFDDLIVAGSAGTPAKRVANLRLALTFLASEDARTPSRQGMLRAWVRASCIRHDFGPLEVRKRPMTYLARIEKLPFPEDLPEWASPLRLPLAARVLVLRVLRELPIRRLFDPAEPVDDRRAMANALLRAMALLKGPADRLRPGVEDTVAVIGAIENAWNIWPVVPLAFRPAYGVRQRSTDPAVTETEGRPAIGGAPAMWAVPAVAELSEADRNSVDKVFPGLPSSMSRERWLRLAQPVRLLGDDLDPDLLERTLTDEMPNLAGAAQRVGDALRLRALGGNRWFRLPPMLLTGAPGIGKTRFARRLAEIAGVPLRLVLAAGQSDDRDLKGTARGWSSADPGAVVRLIADSGVGNPLVLVDEIDKTNQGHRNGCLLDSLLQLLESETAARWHDEALQRVVDLSAVTWLLSANSVEGLPSPLLSRVVVVEVPRPTLAHLPRLLEGLRVDLAVDLDIPPDRLPGLAPEIEDLLADAFARGASVRDLRRALERALAVSLRPPALVM